MRAPGLKKEREKPQFKTFEKCLITSNFVNLSVLMLDLYCVIFSTYLSGLYFRTYVIMVLQRNNLK